MKKEEKNNSKRTALVFAAAVLVLSGLGVLYIKNRTNAELIAQSERQTQEAAGYAKYLALDVLKNLVGNGITSYKMADMFNIETLDKIMTEDCQSNPTNAQGEYATHFKAQCQASIGVLLQYLNAHPAVVQYYVDHADLMNV